MTSHKEVTSTCEQIAVRGLTINIRRWRREEPLRAIFLHGAQDSSITFQPIVDRLPAGWGIAAPDWRGHGWSEAAQDAYWFHDFIADLDAILDDISPSDPVALVGHSLGGNVATIYAALRPERVTRLVSLDAVGLLSARQDTAQALRRFVSLRTIEKPSRVYRDVEEMAARLQMANPRLGPTLASFLAEHSSRAIEGGRRWLHDPRMRRSLPTLRSPEEWRGLWSKVEAPMLLLTSTDYREGQPDDWPSEIERRVQTFANATHIVMPNTSHNLHHDAPEEVARLIEQFLSRPA